MTTPLTPITELPPAVVTALLQAANSQAADVAAQGAVADAQAAAVAANTAVSTAQGEEVTAHSQATADTNAGIQAVTAWIASLVPVATDPNAPPA